MSKIEEMLLQGLIHVQQFFVVGNSMLKLSTSAVLADGNRCALCVSYRDSLRSMYYRWVKQKSLSP